MKTSTLSAALGVVLLSMQAFAASEFVFIGRGDHDIHLVKFDGATGGFSDARVVAKQDAPSFLALSPNHRFLYAVTEGSSPEASSVSGYVIGSDGSLTFLNRQLTGGSGPCHVSVDPSGKWAFAANYGSGSMCVFPVKSDGSLEPRCDFIQNKGSGPNRQRQEGPHAHCVVTDPSGHYVFDCDLGLDEVLIYKLNTDTGALTPSDPPFYRSQPGAGPRHLAFHPNGRFAYLLCEMGSSLTALNFDSANGNLSPIQTVPLLPPSFTGQNISAEVAVHPSGKWVYGSNRGHDSITVFSCDAETGRLNPLQNIPSGGKTPRNFALDTTGAFLLCANQDSGVITAFRIDSSAGRLEESSHKLEIPHPQCVLCLSAPGN